LPNIANSLPIIAKRRRSWWIIVAWALGVCIAESLETRGSNLSASVRKVKAPIQEGEPLIDATAMKEAYREVVRQLGHNRPQISNAYLGSPRITQGLKAQAVEQEGREEV
jgi:hypothetical protein